MAPQGKYWIITYGTTATAHEDFDEMPLSWWNDRGIVYTKGQLELGDTTDYYHWQFVVCFGKKVRLGRLQTIFGANRHFELTRSEQANEYVHLDETSQGRRWEKGRLPTRRNNSTDWDKVWNDAKTGKIEDIPASIRVMSYNALKKIQMDHMKPEGIEKEVTVYYGPTGTGKSRRAWQKATLDAYPKAPTTKFWDGYQGQENIVMDEFFGQIEVSFRVVDFRCINCRLVTC